MLQILALDIGTDMLPALALGAEPPSRTVLQGPARTGGLIDRRLLARAFGVLGPVEAAVELAAFLGVLLVGGWSWGEPASAGLLAAASGTAFVTVVLGQLANAFACRSEHRPVGRWSWQGTVFSWSRLPSSWCCSPRSSACRHSRRCSVRRVPAPVG